MLYQPCDKCEMIAINNIPVHEKGCPNDTPDDLEEYTFDVDEDGPEPDEDDGSNSWTVYRLWLNDAGRVSICWATNDDNDDGEVVTADYGPFDDLQAALRFTHGGSRIGVVGCEVKVFLDGQLILTNHEDDERHNRTYWPYCPYDGPRRRKDD